MGTALTKINLWSVDDVAGHATDAGKKLDRKPRVALAKLVRLKVEANGACVGAGQVGRAIIYRQ